MNGCSTKRCKAYSSFCVNAIIAVVQAQDELCALLRASIVSLCDLSINGEPLGA